MKQPYWFAIVVSLILASVGMAQSVDIPDPKLDAVIRETLNISGARPITQDDMRQLTGNFVARGKGISSLKGLEYATNLIRLYLTDNQISDIRSLTGLTKLITLDLDGNEIRDITPLAGISSLNALDLSGNQISDIEPIKRLTRLYVLELIDNQISDIEPIERLTGLYALSLSGNQITDVSPLARLTNLSFLQLQRNQIRDLDPIAGLTKLTLLYVWKNQISDINVLRGMTQLERLEFSVNQISDISPVRGLTRLVWLNMGENHISDLSPLAGMVNLKTLRAIRNRINDVSPLAGLTNLTEVILLDNQITDISPLAAHRNLELLDLRGNPLNGEAYSVYIPMIRQNNPLNGTSQQTSGLTIPGGLSYDDPLWPTLIVTCSEGGSVLTPGEGTFKIHSGTLLRLEAVPSDSRHEFLAWAGTAVKNGKVADPNAASTTVLVDAGYTLEAVFGEQDEPSEPLGSLGPLWMDDAQSFDYRVATNNSADQELVTFVSDQRPDPTGMIRLEMVDGKSGWIKAAFAKTAARRVRIRFQYLFETGGVDLKVYLSDDPQMPSSGGSLPQTHRQLEVATIAAPQSGWGIAHTDSCNGDILATFDRWIDVDASASAVMNFRNGLWLEMKLELPPDAVITDLSEADKSVLIDDLDVQVYGDGLEFPPEVPDQFEDFEEGFSDPNWTFASGLPWHIISSAYHSPIHSAQSGHIADNGRTSMSMQLYCAHGQISFWRRVSSESNGDFLEFSIDGIVQGRWSGELDWREISFPVEAGMRTFTWTYGKNVASSQGQDCAWIDDITFPKPDLFSEVIVQKVLLREEQIAQEFRDLIARVGDRRARELIVASLQKDPLISRAWMLPDDGTVLITYKCGLNTGIVAEHSFAMDDASWGGEGLAASPAIAIASEPQVKWVIVPAGNPWGYGMYTNGKGLVTGYDDKDCTWMNDLIWSTVQSGVGTWHNEPLTLATIKEFPNYGFIYIGTHGWSDGHAGQNWFLTVERVPAFPPEGNWPVEYRELYNDWKVEKHIYPNNTTGRWAVYASYIRKYCKGLPNSMVFGGFCRSASNGSMFSAFWDCGAKTYMGWSDKQYGLPCVLTNQKIIATLTGTGGGYVGPTPPDLVEILVSQDTSGRRDFVGPTITIGYIYDQCVPEGEKHDSRGSSLRLFGDPDFYWYFVEIRE